MGRKLLLFVLPLLTVLVSGCGGGGGGHGNEAHTGDLQVINHFGNDDGVLGLNDPDNEGALRVIILDKGTSGEVVILADDASLPLSPADTLELGLVPTGTHTIFFCFVGGTIPTTLATGLGGQFADGRIPFTIISGQVVRFYPVRQTASLYIDLIPPDSVFGGTGGGGGGGDAIVHIGNAGSSAGNPIDRVIVSHNNVLVEDRNVNLATGQETMFNLPAGSDYDIRIRWTSGPDTLWFDQVLVAGQPYTSTFAGN